MNHAGTVRGIQKKHVCPICSTRPGCLFLEAAPLSKATTSWATSSFVTDYNRNRKKTNTNSTCWIPRKFARLDKNE